MCILPLVLILYMVCQNWKSVGYWCNDALEIGGRGGGGQGCWYNLVLKLIPYHISSGLKDIPIPAAHAWTAPYRKLPHPTPALIYCTHCAKRKRLPFLPNYITQMSYRTASREVLRSTVFLFLNKKPYVVGTHQKRLRETRGASYAYHNVCFRIGQ